MNIYLTEVEIANNDYASGFAKVAGPRVEAKSEEEARFLVADSGLASYVFVIGKLEDEK